jgi:hypothetical protein
MAVASRSATKSKRAQSPKSKVEGVEAPRTHLWAVLLGIGAFAFCLRCVYLWQIQGAPFLALRFGDGEPYHRWALRIAGGDWLGRGVFYQAPLYPYLLALVYRVFDDSVTTVRVIQAGLEQVPASCCPSPEFNCSGGAAPSPAFYWRSIRRQFFWMA